MNVAERLEKARCLLLAHEPWYGHAAMMMAWDASSRLDTMGVRVDAMGEVQCLYNPAFVSGLSLLELYAVIQHEIEHVVRCHCIRASGSHPVAWNIAADMVVNGCSDAPRIGYRADEFSLPVIPHRDSIAWIPPDWSPDENVEHYYGRLTSGQQDLSAFGATLDDHSIWDDSISQIELAEAVAAIVAEVTGKCRASVPGHLLRPIAPVGAAQVPWQVLLRRYVGAHIAERRNTYARRNRRRDWFGVPGHVRRKHSHVAVIVDVSGSIRPPVLSQFFSELEGITRNARLSVLFWDDDFQGFTPDYQPGDWQKIPVCGGGGTDMAEPVEWLIAQRAVGDCVIILTDGYCNWPARKPFPLVAVIAGTPAPGPPWGRVVRMATA